MRIEKVELRNINSLAGSWSIDLAGTDYAATPIFAITGPTGSGKSTILDAVTLALYGRTPRAGKVTKSDNEVMTKGKGICRCRVTFSTGGKRYIADWSQNRAREKPDGKLQEERVLLVEVKPNGGDQVLVGNKRKEFDRKIEKITGMNYEQFTRSVMLAQGAFSAFLKEKSAQKSEALERITGTAVYSDISTRVHKRHAREEQDYKNLKKQAESIQALTQEERSKLEREQQERQERSKALAAEVTRLSSDKAWIEQAESLVKKKSEAVSRLELANTKVRDSAGLFQKIARADAAQGAKPAIEARYGAAQRLGDKKKRLQEKHDSIPRLTEALDQAGKSLAEKEMGYATVERENEKLSILLKQVAALDASIREKGRALKKAKETFDDKKRALDDAATLLAAEAKKIEDDEKKKRKTCNWLRKNACLEDLPSSICLLELEAEDLKKKDAEEASRKKALEKASEKFEKANKDLAKDQKALLGLESDEEEKKALLEEGNAKKRDLLDKAGVEEVADIGSKLTLLQARQNVLDAYKGAMETRKKAKTKKDDALTARETAKGAAMGAAKALEEKQKLVDALKGEKEALESKLETLSLLQRLSAERPNLVEGEPCPLCGAIHHPWRNRVEEGTGKTKNKLETTKSKLQEENKALDELRGNNAEAVATQVSAERDLKVAEEELSEAATKELGARLAAGDGVTEENVGLLSDQAGSECISLDAISKELALLEKKLRKMQKNATDAEKARSDFENKVKADNTSIKAQQASTDAAREELKKAVDETATARSAFAAAATRFFKDGELPEGTADEIIELLKGMSQTFTTRQAEKTALKEALATEMAKKEVLETRLAAANDELDKARGDLDDKQREHDEAKNERRRIFDDKSVDEEDKKARKRLADAKKEKEKADAAKDCAESDLKVAKATVEDLKNEIPPLEADLKAKTGALKKALEERGFPSEEACEAALIPETELEAKKTEAEEIRHEATRAEEGLKTLETQVADHMAKEHGELSLDETTALLTQKNREKEGIDRQFGTVQERLDNDDKTRKAHATAKEALEEARKNLDGWELLKNLIGSENGSKYRDFVQSLTFKELLRKANVVLEEMTERYSLVAAEGKPLSVDVIDRFHGGETRSSDNLSGGETFLVSLAMALGLSRMVSGSSGIETMFLDEGFGTLDPKALDDALNALVQISDEGRLVGLISHVAEVADRIRLRISVTPKGGGLSTIDGPGVSRIADKDF